MTPPEASSGSAMKQATFSGPNSRILFSRSATHLIAEFLEGHALRAAIGIGRRQVMDDVGDEAHMPRSAGLPETDAVR